MRAPARAVVMACALVVGAAVYLAAPGAAASSPGFQLGGVPASSAALTGAVVVGPGGASTGYYTKVVVVTKGSTLTLVNLDELAHTVTSVAHRSNGTPLFNGNALPGEKANVSGVPGLRPGSYDFYCQFHPNMTGTLIVEGKGGKARKPSKQHYTLPLRIPKVLTGSHITLQAKAANVRVMPHGPKTRMWTFGGSFPGPTIRRPSGHKTKVTYINRLPKAVGGITVHLHGDHHASRDDGLPDRHLIKPGKRLTYTYPLTDGGRPEPQAFAFYHDHRMGKTGRDNWNGLQGMYELTHHGEKKLHLPTGKYDVPLDVADRSLDNLNQLAEPFPQTKADTSGTFGPYSPPGDATVGNTVLVNGEFAPHLNVAAHRYRLRILNSSNFQSYDFALSGGRRMIQISNGSGFLPKPAVRKDILLGPAERADVIVNFHGERHKRVLLKSIPRTDSTPGGIGSVNVPLMQFRVKHKAGDHSRIPKHLPGPGAVKAPSTPTATWTFGLGGNANKGLTWTVNGKPYNPNRVDLSVPRGSTQTWLLENLSDITHYIHIHEEQWHTIARDGKAPPAYERGLVDTWRLDPGESVEVAAKFTNYTGVFMIHCHMLDHEDHGMMAQFAVRKPGASANVAPAGYFMGHGPSLPAKLARLPRDQALATAAAAQNGIKITPKMAAMGMGSMGTGSMGMDGMDEPAPAWMHSLVRLGGVVSIELPLFALGLLWRRRRVLSGLALRTFAILMLAGVAITHASDWLDKLQEAPYLAVGFGLLIAGSGACALGLASWRRTRLVDAVGGWMSGLTVVGYLWSRSIGLPQIPDHVGHWVDPWGIASLVVEVPLVIVACRHWMPQRIREWRPFAPAVSAVRRLVAAHISTIDNQPRGLA
jgi:spore coat protein A, manganese oxidase